MLVIIKSSNTNETHEKDLIKCNLRSIRIKTPLFSFYNIINKTITIH